MAAGVMLLLTARSDDEGHRPGVVQRSVYPMMADSPSADLTRLILRLDPDYHRPLIDRVPE